MLNVSSVELPVGEDELLNSQYNANRLACYYGSEKYIGVAIQFTFLLLFCSEIVFEFCHYNTFIFVHLNIKKQYEQCLMKHGEFSNIFDLN